MIAVSLPKQMHLQVNDQSLKKILTKLLISSVVTTSCKPSEAVLCNVAPFALTKHYSDKAGNALHSAPVFVLPIRDGILPSLSHTHSQNRVLHILVHAWHGAGISGNQPRLLVNLMTSWMWHSALAAGRGHSHTRQEVPSYFTDDIFRSVALSTTAYVPHFCVAKWNVYFRLVVVTVTAGCTCALKPKQRP